MRAMGMHDAKDDRAVELARRLDAIEKTASENFAVHVKDFVGLSERVRSTSANDAANWWCMGDGGYCDRDRKTCEASRADSAARECTPRRIAYCPRNGGGMCLGTETTCKVMNEDRPCVGVE